MNLDAPLVILFKLLVVLLLVVLNGLFVAAEFAFVKLRPTQLEPFLNRGDRRAAVAQRLLGNLEACVSATQVGITLCGVGTGAVVKPVFQALLRPGFDLLGVHSLTVRNSVELGVGFLVSIFLLIVIGELVPKSLAIRKTVATALWTARPLEWFYHLTFPFIWVLNHSAQFFLGKLGIQPISEAAEAHSDEELRLLLGGTRHALAGSATGRNIVLNAFDLRRRLARDVMRPRREITCLNTQASLQECLDVAERTRYSRFPLGVGGDLDRTLGVVHIKDLYGQRQRSRTGADLTTVARKLIFVPETARLETLLQLFLDRRSHLAIVVDEYGGTVGMVTLEDILEELVGQIQDEFDSEKPLVSQVSDNTWAVDGILPLHELANLVGEPLASEEVTTASGLVVQRLGRFPQQGDVLTIGKTELTVEDTDGLRVTRFKLTRKSPEETPPPALSDRQ